MPALDSRVWTPEEFESARDAAPPGDRWELIDGVVYVTPSPNTHHQRIARRLLVQLDAYVRSHGLGEVFTAPLDVRFRRSRIVQPDILVVPPSALTFKAYPSKLLLAAEILSPSSARTDRAIKRPIFQQEQVDEYWIIDGDSCVIERWQPADERPAIITDVLTWYAVGASDPFTLNLTELFTDPTSAPAA